MKTVTYHALKTVGNKIEEVKITRQMIRPGVTFRGSEEHVCFHTTYPAARESIRIANGVN